MKIRDKIICINSQDSHHLVLNEEYVIVDINSHGNLGLKHPQTNSLLRHYYKPYRFKIAPEKPKYYVGQKWRHRLGEVFILAAVDSKYVLVDVYSGYSCGKELHEKMEDVFYDKRSFTEIKD